MSESADWSIDDSRWMRRALRLAKRGQGSVEPNPMVGAVLVRNGHVISHGYHRRFGGPHAEVNALRRVGEAARGASLYVTLEPCCHTGKTPPCTEAILHAGIREVVCAMHDPFPLVAGGGLDALRSNGLLVRAGLLEEKARELNAPYLTLIAKSRPWVISKWAMSWDGKIATHTGDSRWISNEESREIVHQLRGRVDAILVGRRTVERDDPMLTARPAGPRTAARIVLDSRASLPLNSKLIRSAAEAPVILATTSEAPEQRIKGLVDSGCEVLICEDGTPQVSIKKLLEELGRRRFTNLLVEGGGAVQGAFLDAGLVDEVHVFLGHKLIGGSELRTPVAGRGVSEISQAKALGGIRARRLGDDLYFHGRLNTP